MNIPLKTVDFKELPIEIEVKNLDFVKIRPKLMGKAHKATFYQIIWINEGDAVFQIDFKEIAIHPNQLLIISPGQVYSFDTISEYGGRAILFTANFFSITELDSNFLYTAEILNPSSLNKLISVDKLVVGRLIDLLEKELANPTDSYQAEIAQSYLRVILYEAQRQFATHTQPPHPLNNIGRIFFNMVEEHFRQSRNIEFYLNLMNISPKVLSKEVKNLIGQTPKNYLDSRTILEAKRLLSYSSLSIKEIGYQLGFEEPTNFNKYFRKHTSLTPLEFRESQKK